MIWKSKFEKASKQYLTKYYMPDRNTSQDAEAHTGIYLSQQTLCNPAKPLNGPGLVPVCRLLRG